MSEAKLVEPKKGAFSSLRKFLNARADARAQAEQTGKQAGFAPPRIIPCN